jgi:hypothetical protein
MNRDDRPCVEQGICQLFSSWQPKVAHNLHTRVAEIRIYRGFGGLLLMREVSALRGLPPKNI